MSVKLTPHETDIFPNSQLVTATFLDVASS